MKKISSTINQTYQLAKDLLAEISKTKMDKNATVLALSGELGSGKTTFVQGLAKTLGIKDEITSPTFVLLKRFKISGQKKADVKFKSLIHIDAYRIDNAKEMLELGWTDLVANPENLIVVEWAEKIIEVFPPPFFCVSFSHVSEKRREIKLELCYTGKACLAQKQKRKL